VADVWAPLRYGWSHVYWLTIEGIPIVWCERALGKTVPSGYTSESATLVIDGSARVGAMVDRDSGVGAGYPLTLRLLDGAIDAYLTRPTAQTYLTGAETSSDATLSVASTSGLTSPVWIGRERVTYTGTGAGPTLTGCTRGTAGYAWPHRAGAVVSAGAPRSWRGRLVTLYAQPIDPTGYAPGTAWASTSVAIWRGYLDAEPQRSETGAGWDFAAAPLDRLLARPLPAALTGEVVDLEPRFPISQDSISIEVRRYTGGGAMTLTPLNVTPFAAAGYAQGDWISITEANAAITAALDTAIAAAGVVWLSGVKIVQSLTNYKNSTINKGDWVPTLLLAANVATHLLTVTGKWMGHTIPAQSFTFGASGIVVAEGYAFGVAYSWAPYDLQNNKEVTTVPAHVASVKFDTGDPGSLPATGAIVIGEQRYTYSLILATTDAAVVQFSGLEPVGTTAGGPIAVGATATVTVTTQGTLADVVRRVIHSSGEAALRGAYDVLPGWTGYGLPTALVDDDAIGAVLAEGVLATLQLDASPQGASLADIAGGLLRLAGLALCVVDGAGTDAELSAISTAAVASGAAVELRDEHVICYLTREASQAQIEAPSEVTIRLEVGDADGGTIRLIDSDRARDEGAGRPGSAGGAEYVVPSVDRGAMLPVAASYGTARLVGDALASVVEIDVVPWLDVRPGDAVDVALTLPELWDWGAGATGYTGRARCIGRSVSLDTGVQRLRLVVDGLAAAGAALCPAVAVLAVAGGATTPASVDVSRDYYAILAAAYAQRSVTYSRLLYYEPGGGAEGTSCYLDVSGVTDTGSVCRLTVAAYSLPGGGVSTSQGWLTWPHSGANDAWQAQWMHDADGTRWV